MLKKRFREIYQSLGISQSDMSEKIGIKRGNITTVLNTESKNISATIITALAENLPNLNMRWYLTGEGEMWVPEKTEREAELEKEIELKIAVISELKQIFRGDL
mgnify:CR=1 FL=1